MLQFIKNMFYSQFKVKEIPVDVFQNVRSQRKKKQLPAEPQKYEEYLKKPPKRRILRTTESIISDKVKKYLCKLFGDSIKFNETQEKSTNVSSRSDSKYQPQKEIVEEVSLELEEEDLSTFPKYPINKSKHYRTSKKFSTSFRRSFVQRKILKQNIESLNNLYNSSSMYSNLQEPEVKSRKIKFLEVSDKTSIQKNALKNLKSSSFCEVVDEFIKTPKKQSRTKPPNKRLKKTTKSSISTMCDRAKLLLYNNYVEREENPTDQSTEDQEEIITIHNLNNYDSLKSSEEFVKINHLESPLFQAKCRKNYEKISSCTRVNHYSSNDFEHFVGRDFEPDYINGLVAVDVNLSEVNNDECKLSKIPVKKKSKSVKTKRKKSINKCVKDDRNSAVIERLLGGANGMEGHPDRCQKLQRKSNETQNGKKAKMKTSTKIQEPQNWEHKQRHQKCLEISEPGLMKAVASPQKQSIQELKKFQRELKMRIKELEKKMPSTSSPPFGKHNDIKSSSDHELSFLNLSNFLDEDDNEPKVINKVRYCTRKNSFNLKMKFGDKYCECCFLDAKKIPKDICRRCNKKVYLVERICAGEGIYHNFCYTCYYCKRNLNSLNLCVTRGEIFCKQCFKKYFGPEVYGFIK